MNKMKILEVTKENKTQYLEQIALLEEKVLKDMEAKGKIGQLFITGKEDIEQYVDSEENTVMIGIDEKNSIKATAYITQNQSPFTYNDITKYFKYGDEYKEYVKSLYTSKQQYQLDMLKSYELKMKAFKYASDKILMQFPQYKNIKEFLQHELADKQNKFHEKSELRELINRDMVEYVENNYPDSKKLYQTFYWNTVDDIENEFGKAINRNINECEQFINDEISEDFSDIVKNGGLQIYDKPKFDIQKYYTANTENSVEIDTYITAPDNRQFGIARMLVLEGIKKHIKRHFSQTDYDEIFLCSTLHKNNFSSKYVSEFFGLRDSLSVKRRQGRNRQVHICKIKREEAEQYLEHMEKKIVVLYGYNPNEIKITDEEKISILSEQLEYEKAEISRLKRLRKVKDKNLKGKIKLKSKREKINSIKTQIKKIKSKMIEEGESER